MSSQNANGHHRRILSQQNPSLDSASANSNIDKIITQQPDIQHLANSGKIVVINNNNTNINIHHQGNTYSQNSILEKKSSNHQSAKSFDMSNGQIKSGEHSKISKSSSMHHPNGININNNSIRSSVNNSMNSGTGDLHQNHHASLDNSRQMNFLQNEDDLPKMVSSKVQGKASKSHQKKIQQSI